jgi:hypothetical protein
MKTFEIGNLYRLPPKRPEQKYDYSFMIFQTKEMAQQSLKVDGGSYKFLSSIIPVKAAHWRAKWWSDRLKCKVQYSVHFESFIVLGVFDFDEGLLLNVLFSDKIGWIIYRNEYSFDCNPRVVKAA